MEGKPKIIYSKQAKLFLQQLIGLLYEKQYFSFRKNAQQYVVNIQLFIQENINVYPAKNVPKEFEEFGEKYIKYKANEHTTWYIFFIENKNKYLIKFITNNPTNFMERFNLD